MSGCFFSETRCIYERIKQLWAVTVTSTNEAIGFTGHLGQLHYSFHQGSTAILSPKRFCAICRQNQWIFGVFWAIRRKPLQFLYCHEYKYGNSNHQIPCDCPAAIQSSVINYIRFWSPSFRCYFIGNRQMDWNDVVEASGRVARSQQAVAHRHNSESFNKDWRRLSHFI